jgi:hypothetical protein
MRFFGDAADLIGDIGFSVIKNVGCIAIGGGKTLIGVLTEDEELINGGVSQMGKGAFLLASSAVGKAVMDDDDSENDQLFDDFDDFDV